MRLYAVSLSIVLCVVLIGISIFMGDNVFKLPNIGYGLAIVAAVIFIVAKAAVVFKCTRDRKYTYIAPALVDFIYLCLIYKTITEAGVGNLLAIIIALLSIVLFVSECYQIDKRKEKEKREMEEKEKEKREMEEKEKREMEEKEKEKREMEEKEKREMEEKEKEKEL